MDVVMQSHFKALSIILMVILLVGCATSNLYAQADSTGKGPDFARIGLHYGYAGNTTQYLSINLGYPITNRLILDSPMFGVSYISEDPYNSYSSDNTSFYQLLLPMATIFTVAGISGKKNPGFLPVLPLALLNSTLYYSLTGEIHHKLPYLPKKTLGVAPYIKNDTDWFVLRHQKWLQISPGAGVRFQYGSDGGLTVTPGVQRSFQSDFKGHWKKEDMLFLKIGLDFDFDSAMSV
jgi:hypothetical protein